MARPVAVELLHLADLTLPDFHPLAGQPCVVNAFLIRHPEGPVLVDTGVGTGSELIDRLYRPERRPLEEALSAHGMTVGDIVAVVNTHLHFDHCGGNRRFPGVPIYVQAAEREEARAEHYTVPDWVQFPGAQYEALEGEVDIAPGVTVIPTPGHTIGHQSLLIEIGDERVVVAGHAGYRAAEFASEPSAGDAGAAGAWDVDRYRESLARLRGLKPDRVLFGHDPAIWSRE